MALNNFDKNIQQKFNSRKIEPSAQAWDRLDAMLTITEEKKQPSTFFWLKIAATFLVFMGMGYVFFQQNDKKEIAQPGNQVVTSEGKSDNVVSESNSVISEKQQIQNTTETQLAVALPKVSNSANRKISKPNEIKNHQTNQKLLAQNNQQVIAVIQKENSVNQLEKINQKPTYNYVTPETLLAEVQGQKKDNGTVNPYKSSVKVNSNDLLSSIETELNQSFKEKALAKLKQAKSAVVNRNYN